MNEHGFTLLCGADCKIFPTGLTTGVPDGLLWEISKKNCKKISRMKI